MAAVDYPRHYLSGIWPDISEKEEREMVEGMRTSTEPIIVWMLDGQILDGYTRNKCAIQAGRTPEYIDYVGPDPVAFVIQQNALRRHLTASQRAAAVNAAEQWRRSISPESSEDSSGPTQSELAESAEVSRSTMAQVQRADEHGLGPMIRDRRMSAKTADLIVKHELDAQVVAGEISVEEAREVVAEREAERIAAKQETPQESPPVAEEPLIAEPEEVRNDEPDSSDEITVEMPAPTRQNIRELVERIQMIEAEREALLIGAEEDRGIIEELTKENEFLRSISTGLTEDVEEQFRRQEAEKTALRSELNILQVRFNEERDTSNRLRQQLDREKERNGRMRNGVQANTR